VPQAVCFELQFLVRLVLHCQRRAGARQPLCFALLVGRGGARVSAHAESPFKA
jgi:hypothetical protein